MRIFLLIAIILLAASAHASPWTPIDGPEHSAHIIKSDGGNIYAGTARGLYRSFDNGHSWRLTGFTQPVRVLEATPDEVYVGSNAYDGVYRSDSRGRTWEHVGGGLHFFDTQRDFPAGADYGLYRYKFYTPHGVVFSAMACCTDESPYGRNLWRDAGGNWRIDATDWHVGRGVAILDKHGSPTAAVLKAEEDARFRIFEYSNLVFRWLAWPTGWAVLDDTVFITAKEYGPMSNSFLTRFDRINQWRYPVAGLPDSSGVTLRCEVNALVLNRGRVIAGLVNRGVYVFDERSEEWFPAGLDGVTVTSLLSHQSDLYAVTEEGIYRASFPRLSSYNKAAVTWGAIKRP